LALGNDVLLEIGQFVSLDTAAKMVLVNRSLSRSFAHQLYTNVHLKNMDQASRFFQMLQRPSATKLYCCADMVKNLQLGFSLRFGSTDQQNDEDGRHPLFDIYEPFMDDLQHGLDQLHSLTSLNVSVDMDRDPTALTRLINMLDGELEAGSDPFVLRLKCLNNMREEGKKVGVCIAKIQYVSDKE
jgi:hypothetical protein